MNLNDVKYGQYTLVREMFDAVRVVREFDLGTVSRFAPRHNRVLITGEGSSRILPAKHAISGSLRNAYSLRLQTDGATEALDYNLAEWSVFIASNSGKTAECVRLAQHLSSLGHDDIMTVLGHEDSILNSLSRQSYVLRCGYEQAVPATKSVMEQTLFYDTLFRRLNGLDSPEVTVLAGMIETVLTTSPDRSVLDAFDGAGTIYFSGRNNGVAEELTLKANEIVRRKADYLEGTYALHGIEETMERDEVLVVIDPFPGQLEQLKQRLAVNAGLRIVVIGPAETPFPTFVTPRYRGGEAYLQLAAGWNLLVEAGINAGIDIDKPVRVRKIGNEHLEV